jgi:Dihydrodipicolinate reductase
MKKIKIVITGVTGRMGMQIAKRVLKDKSLVLYGATERSGHKAIGKDLGQLLKTKK